MTRLFPDFNRYQPNKHNAYCKKNPTDIIFNHEDFQSRQKFEHKAPNFRYIKKVLTRYMIIVDDTSSISSERDSFSFLHDALRKFIEKDLDRDHTEVGIHVLSENSSNINTNMIKSLISSENREEILGNFWYTEYKYVNIPKCELFEALSQSINALTDRSLTYGQAENIIFVIGPGMNKCSDDKIDSIVTAANHKNIKIVTLNYPAIGSGRIPFDVGGFADKTRGRSFTVFEQKQNEKQSLFSTFFDLANTLLFLSNTYASIPRSLPVEIYRKELFDSGSTRNDDRGIVMDSFHLDSSFSAFNFFVYIYDRRERNIEKGMKLISPTNIQYLTLRELRAEYHQLEILGNFTANGR